MTAKETPTPRVLRPEPGGRLSWPTDGVAGVVIVAAEGQAPDEEFTAAAVALMAAEPRIASVSCANGVVEELAGIDDPLPAPALRPAPTWAPASRPAGSLLVVNAAIGDLVGSPADAAGLITAQSLEAWGRRANERGLRHLWWTAGRRSGGRKAVWAPSQVDVQEAGEALSPLNLLVETHRAAFSRLRVGVEAAWLREHETGAQVATVQWVEALARRDDIAEIVLFNLPGGRLPWYAEHLAQHRARVTIAAADDPVPVPDVFWRPYQPDESTALSRDRRFGRRLVTTVLDLIEFTNERYQGSPEAWYRRRRQFRRYARQVDVLTGISDDVVRHLAVEIPGLEPGRLFTTALGVEHLQPDQAAEVPRGLESLAEPAATPFLLVLGNDFLHKNRDLAIRIWAEVARDRPVDLVLAGLHVGASSTGSFEKELLADLGPVQGRVHRLDHVSGPEKTWLLSRAAVMLYPTSAEGFGFVPHEAAALGTPSAWTGFGPLAEFLPAEGGSTTWRAEDYAARIRALLEDPSSRDSALTDLRQAARALTWQAAGESLSHAFRVALTLPPQPWGLWERTEGGGISQAGDPSEPVGLDALGEAMGRAAHGRGWRTKSAARRARTLAGKARRRARAWRNGR